MNYGTGFIQILILLLINLQTLNSKEEAAGDTKYVDKRIYETRKEIVPLKGNAVCFDEDMK